MWNSQTHSHFLTDCRIRLAQYLHKVRRSRWHFKLKSCKASVCSVWKLQRAAQPLGSTPHKDLFLVNSCKCFISLLLWLISPFLPPLSLQFPVISLHLSLCVSFPSGFLPCTTLSVLFFTPSHTTVRHQAENISNLGWGICLFTALPRNSRAVGLTKAVINRQPGSELRATNREGPAGGGSMLQHTARIYRRTYQSSALREYRGREVKKDRAGVWEYTASPNWLLLLILGELNKWLHAALRFD